MRTAQRILRDASTIAVVGASPDKYDEAHWMPEQLQHFGWRIIPVDAGVTELFGERCYPRLADITTPVDIVDVFDTTEDATEIVREAIAIGATSVWLEPLHNHRANVSKARQLAAEAGVAYLEDQSTATERAIASMVRSDTRTEPELASTARDRQPATVNSDRRYVATTAALPRSACLAYEQPPTDAYEWRMADGGWREFTRPR
jgi:predicted CoA-binding protein